MVRFSITLIDGSFLIGIHKAHGLSLQLHRAVCCPYIIFPYDGVIRLPEIVCNGICWLHLSRNIFQMRLQIHLCIVLRPKHSWITFSWAGLRFLAALLPAAVRCVGGRCNSATWENLTFLLAWAHDAKLREVGLRFTKHAILLSADVAFGNHSPKRFLVFSMLHLIIIIYLCLGIYEFLRQNEVKSGDVLKLPEPFFSIEGSHPVVDSRQLEIAGAQGRLGFLTWKAITVADIGNAFRQTVIFVDESYLLVET